MKKTIVIFSAIITILTGCSKSDNEIEPQGDPRILTVTAGSDPSSEARIVYSDGGFVTNGYLVAGKVSVAFQVGETLEFTFAQGATYKKTTATVTSVTAATTSSPATCTFTLAVPADISTTDPYDLYSVAAGQHNNSNYKGNYIDPDNPRYVRQNVVLNTSNDRETDKEVADQIIQVATLKNIPAGTTKISLSYKHLGALIGFVINNRSSSTLGFYQLSIVDQSGNSWVYAPTARYNLTTSAWEGATATTTATATVANLFSDAGGYKYYLSGDIYATYRWIIPTGTAPGNLSVRMLRTNGTYYYSPIGAKTPAVGYRYRINRIWNGSAFSTPAVP